MEFKNQARVIYFLMTYGWVLFLKFSSNYLNTFGLDSDEIGIVMTTAWSVGIFIGPIWGMVIDKYESPNFFLAIKFLSFPIAYFTMQFIIRDQNTFLSLLLINLFAQILWYGSNEITDAVVINSIDNQNKIGEIKFTGSLGMLFGSSYGLIASQFGWDYVIMLNIILMGSLSLFVHHQQPFIYIKKKRAFRLMVEIKKLFRNKQILIVYLGSILFWSTFFIIDCFVWLYFEREFGASMMFIGCCLLAQKCPEIFVSYSTELFITRLSCKGMQIVAFFILALRFYLMSLLTKENYLWGAILTESMHSFSLIFMTIASLLMINKFSPKSLISTAQTINSSCNRIGSLLGGSASSYVYKVYGGKVLMSLSCLSVFVMMLVYIMILYFFFDDSEEADTVQEQELLSIYSQN